MKELRHAGSKGKTSTEKTTQKQKQNTNQTTTKTKPREYAHALEEVLFAREERATDERVSFGGESHSSARRSHSARVPNKLPTSRGTSTDLFLKEKAHYQPPPSGARHIPILWIQPSNHRKVLPADDRDTGRRDHMSHLPAFNSFCWLSPCILHCC